MKDLATITATMTSLEIAELTGKRHDNVIRDIRKMFKELEIDPLNFEDTRIIKGVGDNPDRPSKMYKLDQYLSLMMLNKLSPEFTKQLMAQLPDIQIRTMLETLSAIDLTELPKEQFIYVAKEKVSGRYKVGISIHPKERIKQLNIGNPEELELIYTAQARDGFKTEKFVHKMLETSNIRSEWFSDISKLELNKSIELEAV